MLFVLYAPSSFVTLVVICGHAPQIINSPVVDYDVYQSYIENSSCHRRTLDKPCALTSHVTIIILIYNRLVK